MAISSAALNGTNSSAKYQSVYLEFWQVSQSVENNQTTFGYKAYMKSNVSGANGNTAYGHYTFTGATSIAKVSNLTWTWNYTTSQLIKEGTFTKTHNADGTLANQTLTVTAGGSTALGYATVSVTLPVATIPRATTPTLDYTTRDMGAAILITVNGASTAFTHNLYYAFPGIGTTFITTVAAGTTSYLWTIPTATLAPNIPNATSGTVTITADTLSGTTVIGTKTTTFTATVPASVVPIISEVTATEAGAGIASQFGAFIQNRSNLSLAMAASGIYGSTISSYSITGNGQTFSASSGTTSLLNTAGTNTITYRATDSRGRSATATLNVTVLAYIAPQISVFNVERVNASGVADATGDRVKATYAITVTSLNDRNPKAYTLQYKTSTASTYTSIALDATSFTPNTTIIPAVTFNTSNVYNFQLVAADYFESTIATRAVNSGFIPMHFRAGGKGVGIGKANEGKAILEVFGDCILQNTESDTRLFLEQIQGNAGIEIGSQTLAGMVYIDFHSGGQGSDYDARIIADGGTSLDGQGSLNFTCGEMNFSATPKIGGYAMIDSGENANGIYIRFSDGTQICHGIKALTTISDIREYITTITMPASFVNVWYSFSALEDIGHGSLAHSIQTYGTRSKTASSIELNVWHAYGAPGGVHPINFSWTAIGRWK